MGHPGGYTTLDYGGNPYQTTSHSTNRFLSSHGFQPDGTHARHAVEFPEFAPGGHNFLHGGSLRNLSAPCCLVARIRIKRLGSKNADEVWSQENAELNGTDLMVQLHGHGWLRSKEWLQQHAKAIQVGHAIVHRKSQNYCWWINSITPWCEMLRSCNAGQSDSMYIVRISILSRICCNIVQCSMYLCMYCLHPSSFIFERTATQRLRLRYGCYIQWIGRALERSLILRHPLMLVGRMVDIRVQWWWRPKKSNQAFARLYLNSPCHLFVWFVTSPGQNLKLIHSLDFLKFSFSARFSYGLVRCWRRSCSWVPTRWCGWCCQVSLQQAVVGIGRKGEGE